MLNFVEEKLELLEKFGNTGFWFISTDSCYKTDIFKITDIPLTDIWVTNLA